MKRLLLHNLHERLGARFEEYGDWQLPLFYESIITEHTYVRVSSALFDLSYLGRIEISGKDAEPFLERHVTRHLAKRPVGRGFYALMLTEKGTIFADCVVYKLRERFIVSVNPLVKEKVLERLKQDAPEGVLLHDISEKILCFALQGRRAQFHLQRLTDMELSRLKSGFACEAFATGGAEVVIGRVGYTGEDGFEILLDCSYGERFFETILELGTSEYLIPAGVGARNSLRIEAGFLLYGSEIDEETTPFEADLAQFVSADKQFIGREVFLSEREKALKKKIVSISVEQPRIPREGSPIFADGKRVGTVTRGTYSPVLSRSIALGYIEPRFAQIGRELEIEIRGRRVKAKVARKPFYLKKHTQ
ncbi:MAG: glycine cleavage system aminomethyltransferase GcvT [Planctomycetota bacterium]|nr:glycine cleavage system aminomethyltransferase GcvT [Planctomycetota bacterium]